MTVRTTEQLSDTLARDLIWRKKELSSLRFALERVARGTSVHEALLRSCLALLYAHWEGYIRHAGAAYLEYLVAQKLRVADLTPNFFALAIGGRVQLAFASKRMQPRIEMIGYMRSELSEIFRIPSKDVVHARANVSSRVLQEIVAALGLDYAPFESKAVLIDERLLEGRNQIAHGQYLRIGHAEYVTLHSEIIDLLDIFRNLVENAVALRAYRAA